MSLIARILLAAVLLFSLPASAEEIVGKVVGITDGDTLTLLTPQNLQVKVRLSDIDTPESKQPYGSRAKQALSDIAFGKIARIDVHTTDLYGRSVARVYVGSTDVNATLVDQGAAWVYRKYSNDAHLLDLEAAARNAHRGLWALPEAEQVPPWEWRHAAKSEAIQAPSATQESAAAPTSNDFVSPGSPARPPADRPVVSVAPAVITKGSGGHHGACNVPSDLDSRGHRCGARAASERPGGR
ncbi:thermonuclease family protein [uncultured Thiodictyon sp.]|uniref:thermonuclease family protein n=1 Tax=uncultured Thiodictyon sp. TaxID=1846217 RepID=UPI0025F0A1F8|nr:thermonuclease family protein [uncultured Thiodictyon sp.]